MGRVIGKSKAAIIQIGFKNMNLTAPLKFNKTNLFYLGFGVFALVLAVLTSLYIFSYFRRLAIKSEELSSNLKSVSLQKSDLDKKVI